MKYVPRLIDKPLKQELEAFGAVLINGPKWCGKTTTAETLAKSIIEIHDPKLTKQYKTLAKESPALLLEGAKPRLIDEWQLAPELWDAIRYDIDKKNQDGLYILTGSNEVDESVIEHSGAGRISRLFMRTMSLYESGDSTGQISLFDLFENKEISDCISETTDEDYANLIARGGWPKSIHKDISVAKRQIAGYIRTITLSEVNTVDGVKRDASKARSILRSLARNTGTNASNITILADVVANSGSMHENTLDSYLGAFRKIYIIDDVEAWSPQLRSKTVIRTANTRYLVDPALAMSLLGASTKDLLFDRETFGFLFESLAIRDLKIYAQHIGADVKHYRDKSGLEADAIISLENGKWCAIEIKLGQSDIDKAAANLLKLVDVVDTTVVNMPSFLAIVTGTKYAYRRKDGVYVLPLALLKP